MEPVSAVASVAGVATAVLQITKSIYEMAQAVQNAPAEIAAIADDAHAINTILLTLSLLFKDQETMHVVSSDEDVVKPIRNLEQPLRNCWALLRQLEVKLNSHLKPIEGGRKKVSSVDLKWYFTKNEVRDLVTRLESTKSTLDLALNNISVVCNLRSLGLDPKSVRDQGGRQRDRHGKDPDSSFAIKRYLESVAPETPTQENDFMKAMTISDFDPPELTPNDSISIREASKPAMHPNHSSNILERLKRKEDERARFHKAAREGDEMILEVMLEEGMNVDIRAADGRTALHLIAENGNEAGARVLLHYGANVNAVSNSKGNPLERKFGGGRTPLHWAAEYGQAGMARVLIEAGADINIQNASGRTALQEAIRDGADPTAKLLIDTGASLSLVDDENWTPLHQAAQDGRTEIVKILLEKGLDMEAVVTDQNIWEVLTTGRATPLILAVGASRIQTAQFLIFRGADIRAENILGEQPIHIASLRGLLPLVKQFLEEGVDIETRDSRYNETPLLKAASTGRTDVILYLLQKGADINAKTQRDRNALVHCQLHEKGRHPEAVLVIKKWMQEHGKAEEVKRMLLPEFQDSESPLPT